jgi:two-component system CheB/CheR fusion protein
VSDPTESVASFPVVGVGASAGGLEACLALLANLPPKTGMAFVLVQHLEPHQISHLPEILSRATTIPVAHAQNEMPVEPDRFYVVPPNAVLTIDGGQLRLSPREESQNQYYPIDQFFFSLAKDQGSRAIGVVLSGSSADGAQGLRTIKCAGGTTFCQDEQSAKHDAMPRSAIATGAADFVLPPAEIAAELARMAKHPYLNGEGVTDAGFAKPDEQGGEHSRQRKRDQDDVRKILILLRKQMGVDFTQYKQNTILRRIARRMLVNNCTSLGEYAGYLESHSSEPNLLYQDILISVTQFFREPAVFDALARCFRDLIVTRDRNAPIRIWVPGCATGEEAYSLAIALTEVVETANLATPIQVFGTDISDIAIDRARAGNYPEAIRDDVSPERLRRFFVKTENGYRISNTIREVCIFARHDLTRDPPFSQLDIVSCRNLMIYLDGDAQQRVLPALHYSLKPESLLLLGTAEGIGTRSDIFNVIAHEHRIFSKKPGSSRFAMTLPDPRNLEAVKTDWHPKQLTLAAGLVDVEVRATRILRDLYAPPGVTVNDSMQIVHFHGQTSFYLEPPTGEASLNLLRVAHESLLFPLRKAIDAVAEHWKPAVETGIRMERGSEVREISLRVIPISQGNVRYYVVLFEDGSTAKASVASFEEPVGTSNVLEYQLTQARREVDETREYLRKIMEQHEVAIEELRAAHEEVQSSNEELQSTNEELRTAKEELQSSNEELRTVNDELKNRNDALAAANNDLTNVLYAVNIPIVMVGMDLKIRRLTPAAERFLNSAGGDVGRSITDALYSVDVPGFKTMLNDAIQTLMVQEKKVQNREGRWFSVVVRPYRTTDDRIDGAVVSFFDIDDVTRALDSAKAARSFSEGIVETVQHPLLVLDSELHVERATAAFYRDFQTTPEETIGNRIFTIGNGQWNTPQLRRLLDDALLRDVAFRDLDIEHDFLQIGRRTMRLNARRIPGLDRVPHRLLLAIEDVTDRREAAEVQYRRLFESAKDGIIVVNGTTGLVLDVNPFFLELTRYSRLEIVGLPFWEIPPFRKAEEGRRLVPESREREVTYFDSVRLQSHDNRPLIVEMVANRDRVKGESIIQVNIRDVTQRRQAEEDLRRSNLDLQQFAFAASHDLQEPLRTVINHVELLQREYGGKLGPEADEIIAFITSATDRMRHMVLDLLNYAQTARAAIAPVPTSVEAVLAIAMSNLQLAIETTGSRITFDPLPTVQMDPTQLLQLLQNLIGNAIKYRRQDAPRIHLSANRRGSEWIVSVRDNGLGIDHKFHEHIFTVFKRLHGREYPGTGIGLATCLRIVDRHGGRIWLESEVGEGSTFFFSVPIPSVP